MPGNVFAAHVFIDGDPENIFAAHREPKGSCPPSALPTRQRLYGLGRVRSLSCRHYRHNNLDRGGAGVQWRSAQDFIDDQRFSHPLINVLGNIS